MNRILFFILISFFLVSCSLNDNSKIWTKKNQNTQSDKNIKVILTKKSNFQKELNPDIKFNLTKIKYRDNISDLTNNFGSSNYVGSLNKIDDYDFSKFKDVEKLNFKPLFLSNGLIFFDKTGSIIRYDSNAKILWKKNYYNKSEKKISPKLNFAINGKNLIVTDDIAKIYSIDVISGNLQWSKFNNYPLNSEIKIYKDNFFVVDYKNTLRCFKIHDGSECWNVPTENSLTISGTRYSIIISNDLVIFNNSIGDITAVNISTGLISWQLPTQKSSIINESYSFINSQLVADENSIYFSNNKNEFYSVDLAKGVIKWMNKVNSTLTPILINDFIFTISEDGFLITIQKKNGNILRINDIYKDYKNKHRKKIKPVGFSIGQNKLYLSNTDGKMIQVELNSGRPLKLIKVSGNIISKPFIHNGNLFVIKNGSVIRYN